MTAPPRLRPHLVPVRLGAGVVQLGHDPQDAIILEGLSDAESALLDLLDGRCELGRPRARPALLGIAPQRIDRLLEVLDAQGALLPGEGRDERQVSVGGDPALAPVLADGLRSCGLFVGDDGAVDVLAGPLGFAPPVPEGRAALAVQLGQRHIVVGPLVPRDRGDLDPCPACVGGHATRWLAPAQPPPARVFLAAAALVSAHLEAYLAGEPLVVGATYEVDLVRLATTTHLWQRDPRCPACRPAAGPLDAVATYDRGRTDERG